VRGALHGTMLRNDIFDFCRLGTFLERADNTARILDVKYYVLLPSVMSRSARRSTTCSGRRSCVRSRAARLPLAQQGRRVAPWASPIS
jgi:uncharacterized alpha-E superfamily protein